MNEVEVCIEIPYNSNVKYEIENGKIICDRVLHTPMSYPFNYGYIVDTLADDGDHLDAVLMTQTPFVPNCYIRAKIIGALITEDEKGMDEKVLLVPVKSVDPKFSDVNDITDITADQKEQVKFFFEYYKTLEKGKWIKVGDFVDQCEAVEIYNRSAANYRN